jgi:signal transduction histidine kinase
VNRPRSSVRLRLTLWYGGLFFLSGVGLLTITYLLVAVRPPVVGGDVKFAPHDGLPPLPPPTTEMQSQMARLAADVLNEFLVQSGISLTMMTVASIGLGWFVAGRVLRPLRTITTTARTISASNLHERLALSGPDDELKELGDTFDELLGRLQASFDAQRQFAANVSHELRTPLTRARTLLEVALTDPRPTIAGLQQACNRALVANQDQERLIGSLLTLARSEHRIDHGEPVDVRTLAHETLLTFGPQAQSRGLRVDVTLDAAEAWGDPRLIERLITNLVDNAIRHNTSGGRIEVTTTTTNGHAALVVANSGPVIAPHEVARLMRPFQRLAPDRTAARDGHGLGLAIVHAIASTHDAQLIAHPRPDGGLAVRITFPVKKPR